ncbi:MAG: lysophospholipid acyltransferase family protein [Candidatus Omnitrophica bacterium]|nr:lysophospholipid acyltransferase family protein [Candidatus Omnitrophota bacterium]
MIPHQKNAWVTRWFSGLAESKLRKNFRRCSLTQTSVIPDFEPGVPILGLVNHTSWWDALMGMYMARRVFRKDFYGVFAAEELRRYGIFRLVGCYGLDRSDPRDFKPFLKYTREILSGKSAILWIFPQGELMSHDDSPMKFKTGFAHIARQFPRVHLLKINLFYDFWVDSKPEIVIDVLPLETVVPRKEPGFVDELTDGTAREMSERLEAVRRIVRERDSAALKELFRREHGANFFYDFYRGLKALVRGERFRRAHTDD